MPIRIIDNRSDKEKLEEAEKFASTFAKKMAGVRKNIGSETDEVENLETLQAMLEATNELIEIAESNYRRYKIDKAAYTFAALTNISRELINDIRAISTFNERSNIIKTFVSEATTLILQNMLDSGSYLRDTLANKLDIGTDTYKRQLLDDLLKGFLQDHGKYIVETSKEVEAKIDGFITKTPTIPKTRKLLK